jgi:DNA-binding NarL/FixJ family response regulator
MTGDAAGTAGGPVLDTIAVFAVDDHPAFLRSVGFVIAATPGFALVGTAGRGLDALEALARRSDVDLVLLDVNLPDLSGVEVARRLAGAGGGPVVVLMSTTDPDDLPADALGGGVAGFLSKELLTTRALRTVWDDVADVS